MNKILRVLTLLLLSLSVFLGGCTVHTNTQDGNGVGEDGDGSQQAGSTCAHHEDEDADELCDVCGESTVYTFCVYAFNDLHGVFCDTAADTGVATLTTYFNRVQKDKIILSTGDTWQGSSESNLTGGRIMTDWMNSLGVASMTLGNHEFDFGEDVISENAAMANFPLLAINVYDKDTNERVSYAKPSTIVDLGELQVGIIGAIGDCYSSISGEVSGGFYFKTGDELTALVKEEANRLKDDGADYIIYSLHDGAQKNSSYISPDELSAYYDISLSDGYVDLVFEGHTHKTYVYKDAYGVYHMQGGGYNSALSVADISLNLISGKIKTNASTVSSELYARMEADPIVDSLLEKYSDEIAAAHEVLGVLSYPLYSSALEQLVADLYLKAALEMWQDEYDIVLGGGFIRTRNPYDLDSGEVRYSDVQALFPFDNEIVLCTVSGKKLLSQFIQTTSADYYVAMSEYGKSLDIDPTATYYIVVDTYTSTYAYNELTEVERYTRGVYARDLLADYFRQSLNE